MGNSYESTPRILTDDCIIERKTSTILPASAQCLHLKISLLGASPKATMSLFCTLLRGTVPPTTALRDPIGVDWGLRRLQHNGSETRLTLWALSAAEAFSELRADLCSQSHTIVLVLDAESARLSEQLQQLKRLLQSAQLHLQPGQNPALFLVAAGGQGCVWAKAAAECRRFAAVHHCRFLEVQPLSTAGTESLLHLLASSNLRLVEAEE